MLLTREQQELLRIRKETFELKGEPCWDLTDLPTASSATGLRDQRLDRLSLFRMTVKKSGLWTEKHQGRDRLKMTGNVPSLGFILHFVSFHCVLVTCSHFSVTAKSEAPRATLSGTQGLETTLKKNSGHCEARRSSRPARSVQICLVASVWQQYDALRVH